MASVIESDEYGRKLDAMGFTLHYVLDPVDHSQVPALFEDEVIALVKHFEEALREAIEARPIRIEVPLPRVVGQRRVWTMEQVLAHLTESPIAPRFCKCGLAPHDESDERPASVWVGGN